ncbi:hypothetical protein GCM10023144_01650 [Pigmentiphaga soli]|uniref:Uncharacterized protein n=1 Tax=Pigmentiphaga soli TaxID=1007095 RepID=A0ABP8GCU4_9BURK
MPETYIPTACLADARRVLQAQDPTVSQLLAQRWSMSQWRAAVKLAAQEIEHAT